MGWFIQNGISLRRGRTILEPKVQLAYTKSTQETEVFVGFLIWVGRISPEFLNPFSSTKVAKQFWVPCSDSKPKFVKAWLGVGVADQTTHGAQHTCDDDHLHPASCPSGRFVVCGFPPHDHPNPNIRRITSGFCVHDKARTLSSRVAMPSLRQI